MSTKISTRLVLLAVLASGILAACGDDGTSGGNTGGTNGTEPSPTSADGVYDFLATELNFYYPEGLGESEVDATNPCGLNASTDNTTYRPLLFDDVVVDGFDLDETLSTDASGQCGQADYGSIDGSSGVDYGFLGIIDMIRPIRPDRPRQCAIGRPHQLWHSAFGCRQLGQRRRDRSFHRPHKRGPTARH